MANPDEATSSLGSEQSREEIADRLKVLAARFDRGELIGQTDYAYNSAYDLRNAAEALALLSTAHAEGLGKEDVASRADSATRLASQGCDTDAPHSAGFQVHILKTHPGPFAAVRARVKKLEIRRDDRGYSVGDTLWLEEFDPETEARSGEVEVRLVTHVLPGGQYGIEPGYVAMSVEEIRPSSEARDELSLALARQRELETERDEWKEKFRVEWGNHAATIVREQAAETRQRELEEALREVTEFAASAASDTMTKRAVISRARALLSPPTQDNPHG